MIAELDPTAKVWVGEVDVGGGPPAWSSRTSVSDWELCDVGELEGAPELVFGKVEDAAIDGEGKLYVLDSRLNEVRVFGNDCHFEQGVGRPGRGPGEFVQPTSVAVETGSDQLYVGDGSFSVHVFRRIDGNLRFDRRFRTITRPEDICVMHDELFVHGLTLTDKRVVHVYGLDGEYRRSFGVVYDSGNSLIDFEIATGRISCVPSDSLVVYVARQFLPELRAYARNGELVWRTSLGNYKSLIFEEIPRGTRQRAPVDGFHRLVALAAGPDGDILLQLALVVDRSQVERGEFRELHTLIFSAGSGIGREISGISAPVLVVSSELAVLAKNDPYPKLTIASYRGMTVGTGKR